MKTTIALLMCIFAAGILATCAQAYEPLAEVGIGQSVYSDDSGDDFHYTVKLGEKDFPVYLVGGYEQPVIRMTGQRIAETDVWSVGVGARKSFNDFYVFAEAGLAYIEEDTYDTTVHEAAYTDLVGTHAVGGRVIPVDNPYRGYEASYEAKNGPFWELGVGYQLWDHVALTASYRGLVVDQHYAIWDQERRDNGGGWWEETNSLDLSSFKATILVTY
jgi:hypothetical protein